MGPEARRALADVGYGIRCLWPGILVLAIVALVVTLDSCSGEVATARAAQDEPFEGRFEWHETGTTSTYVLVDRETGVCYVARYKCGLSVMVGADGEPVTVGEIEGSDGTSDR